MIHYHGGPITPLKVAHAAWTGRHAFVSFARPEQVALAAEICQSFALDNGAFSLWRAGKGGVDVGAYAEWVREWRRHPGFDFAVIPDAIDGDENANEKLITAWIGEGMAPLDDAIPVWHLHESIERLQALCVRFRRVALGSSGAYADPGSPLWWGRMADAMAAICDEQGRPRARLHGLRMLNPTIFSHLPFASADSTNAAQNHSRSRRLYALTETMQALVLIDRIERHASAARWTGSAGVHANLDLIG